MVMDDANNIWGEDDETSQREWTKIDEEFTNAGYREGITAGKESALQEGFDDGFDNVGVPLGREVGILRGVASAVMVLLSPSTERLKRPPRDREKLMEEVRVIVQELGQIHLEDIAPRDLQAEEHAKKHMDNITTGDLPLPGTDGHDSDNGGGSSQSVENQLEASNGHPAIPRPALLKLRRLCGRLSDVLKELGLDVALE